MNVGTIMRTKLILVKQDCPFPELLRKLSGHSPHQAYVVNDEYRLLGIISSKDLLTQMIPSYLSADLARSFTDETDFFVKQLERLKDKRADEFMNSKPVSLEQHHQLLEADALIAEHGFNTLPVVDNQGRIIGEVTRMDILSQLVNSDTSVKEDDLIDVSKL